MTGSVTVHLVDRLREPLDRLLERGAKVLIEAGVLDRSSGARRDDAEELALPFVEALGLGEAHDADEAQEARLHLQRNREDGDQGDVGLLFEEPATLGPLLEQSRVA